MDAGDRLLNTFAFLLAAECLEAGDLTRLASMGFEPGDIQVLRSLTLAELQRLAGLGDTFLTVRVDRAVLERVLDHLQREREAMKIRDALIRRGAPSGLLHALYGLSPAEVAALRRLLGVASAGGRPALPDESGAERAWRWWHRHGSNGTALQPADWLRFTRDTELDLPALWQLVRQWREETPSPRPVTDSRKAHVVRRGAG
jgi:hypothetical protein